MLRDGLPEKRWSIWEFCCHQLLCCLRITNKGELCLLPLEGTWHNMTTCSFCITDQKKKNLINCEKHLCVSEENAKDRALPSNKKQYRSFTIYQLLKAMTIKQKYFLEALYKQLCVRGHSIEAKTAILHHIHWRTTGCLQVLLKMQKHQQQLQKGSHYAGRHPQEQVLLLYRVTWKNTSRKILR